MTSAGPPLSGDAAPEPSGDALSDARSTAARLAAADAARLAADVRTHEEHVARLQAEANARAADDARLVAEARVRELEGQLSALLDAQDAAEEAAAADPPPGDPHSLSLFDDEQAVEPAGNGSDPALPKILAGCAVVSGVATLVVFFSGGVGLGLVMLAITVAILWLAGSQRVQPIEISVTRGVVHIAQGDSKHRFDLTNERTQVEMRGEPGDHDWEVRFLRRGLDPFVVRAAMVEDPRSLVGRLREWRPEL